MCQTHMEKSISQGPRLFHISEQVFEEPQDHSPSSASWMLMFLNKNSKSLPSVKGHVMTFVVALMHVNTFSSGATCQSR